MSCARSMSWSVAGAFGGGESGIELSCREPVSWVARRCRPGCGDAEISPRLSL